MSGLTPWIPGLFTDTSQHIRLVLFSFSLFHFLVWFRTVDVLRKDDDDWVKKCMEYEVEGSRPREDQRGPGKRLFERTVKHVS